MLSSPYSNSFLPNSNFFAAYRQPVSYVRMLHAVPGAEAVDVYVNDNLVAQSLAYRSFTPYLPLVPGRYRIVIYRTGITAMPLVDVTFDLPAASVYTVTAVGTPGNFALLPVADPVVPRNPAMVNLRFVNLSPNAPPVDVTSFGNIILFRNIGYQQVSNYISVNPGTYTFEFRPTGTNQLILYVPNIRLIPNRNYTIYMIGLTDREPSLQVLIPLDGSTYLNPMQGIAP